DRSLVQRQLELMDTPIICFPPVCQSVPVQWLISGAWSPPAHCQWIQSNWLGSSSMGYRVAILSHWSAIIFPQVTFSNIDCTGVLQWSFNHPNLILQTKAFAIKQLVSLIVYRYSGIV